MKRLLLVLIVLLLLFAAMLIYGFTRDRSDESASQEPNWMGMFDSITRKEPVTSADFLPAQCMASGSFRALPNLPCKVHIRSTDSSHLRAMKLQMTSGAKIEVNLQTLGSNGMSIPVALNSNSPKSSELQIPKDGADLSIECKQTAPVLPFCQVNLSK